jgi:hypothetical protein
VSPNSCISMAIKSSFTTVPLSLRAAAFARMEARVWAVVSAIPPRTYELGKLVYSCAMGEVGLRRLLSLSSKLVRR